MNRSPEQIVDEIRRQRTIKNMIWPCIFLSELEILCNAYERLKKPNSKDGKSSGNQLELFS